jgi:hypothetical protein
MLDGIERLHEQGSKSIALKLALGGTRGGVKGVYGGDATSRA